MEGLFPAGASDPDVGPAELLEVADGQAEHLQDGLFGGELAAVAGDLPEPGVDRLDQVGPSQRGNHGRPGAAYNDKQRRNEEKIAVENAERAYQVLVTHWQPRRPTRA